MKRKDKKIISRMLSIPALLFSIWLLFNMPSELLWQIYCGLGILIGIVIFIDTWFFDCSLMETEDDWWI